MTCPDCHKKLHFEDIQERYGVVRREYSGCVCEKHLSRRISFERLVEISFSREKIDQHLDTDLH